MTHEQQKAEAIERLKTLAEKFELGNKLENYFKEGKLYYSYAYSMDTITYDKRYEDAAASFEKMYGGLVYHAVESKTAYGKMLSLFFVGNNEAEWKFERLADDTIFTYTFVVDEDFYDGEFGSIRLASPMGYLMRIG